MPGKLMCPHGDMPTLTAGSEARWVSTYARELGVTRGQAFRVKSTNQLLSGPEADLGWECEAGDG